MNQLKKSDSVNLFWTGGWDSTFQLLYFILIHQCPVKPYYVLDEERESTGIEIYSRSIIQKLIKEKYPDAYPLIHSTRYISKEDIEKDHIISSSWNIINLHHHIGTQYEWLARFCKQNSINKMQIGLFKSESEKPPSEFYKYHMKYFTLREENPDKLEINHLMNDYHVLFKYFDGSLLDTTKNEMYRFARDQKWLEILEKTNFCYRPSVRIKACGKCAPCNQAIDNSMSWRIPLSGKIARLNYKLKCFVKEKLLSLQIVLKLIGNSKHNV